MKKMITLSMLALLASHSVMALTISGKEAQTLRSALIKAGAEVKIMTEVSTLTVSSLECDQEGGIVLLPYKCQFVDKSSGRLEEVMGPKAESIVKSLTDAGLKGTSTRAGEMSHNKISAKSVNCTTAAMPHPSINCNIKK